MQQEVINNSHKVEKNNLTILKNLVSIAEEKSCKLVHLSSTSVYGTQSDLVDEDCKKSELKPQSPYAESKLKEEDVFETSIEIAFLTFA
jgi:nucleoside-diphosphate-sugar epimerase